MSIEKMEIGPILVNEGWVWLGTDEKGTVAALTPKDAIWLASELLKAATTIIDQEGA